MVVSRFSESLVNIYTIIDNKINKEQVKERKLEYIDDCIDWLNTLKDILVKRKKEIENANGKEEFTEILNKLVIGGINQPMGHRFNKKQNEAKKN